MNADTEYVRMHIVNYEPTYVALNHAVSLYWNDEGKGIAAARDYLREAVERHYRDAGLNDEHLTDDVDYGDIIVWECDNRDSA